MKKPIPIHIVDLLPKLDRLLIELLDSLSINDWSKQTIAPEWQIKDVAVHLLDGNLRTLSMLRDHYYGEKPAQIDSYQDLVAYLNQLNADWVKATKRLSPQVIIEWLKKSGEEYCDFLKTLAPNDNAAFSVAWAGENESKNWFHIAREYTEKWHHQQQIRLAVQREKELLKAEWYLPYLDTSVRALPYHYRSVKGVANDLIKFTFRGETDKIWFLKYQDNKWELLTEVDERPNCEVIIKDAYAWRIFTKGMDKKEAIELSEIIGNRAIGLSIFEMTAVMA
ncbi:MAG: maleylpyruvate isomerase N-terminal domain-containing protein [Saprospiraceae bacterium]